ncbi:NACHT, LRR and PYD domains-containing protein 14 isoform X3 [Ochotona princeps]|uniref:NACHT, LRR and PYD domains-containing protein 14 isoform X3 n=1 Tax=Ochotona princeps TaxID=9978 RepID=UPI002714F875|nr:NACHT, LRR and PYD domains-containing protein 14 isoform X3 [Ochotona princeps]
MTAPQERKGLQGPMYFIDFDHFSPLEADYQFMDMMADSSSSYFSDFGLLLYFEELNKEEFNNFKLLLKQRTDALIPWSAVKNAKREDLANLMNKYYPREQAWNVTLQIFGKMNLKGLCERAKAEINCSAKTMEPEDVEDKEIHSDQDLVLDSRTEYRSQIKEKFSLLWDNSPFLGDLGILHYRIAQEEKKLLEHLFDVDIKTGEQPKTVVLHGAAGVGKTQLARQAMLDWAEGNLYQQRFAYVFYLNAREMNQLNESSFAELISKDWPSTKYPIEKILSQPNSLLFIIDSFDELNFAFEEPEFALCNDWSQVHPVSFLLSSLLRKVMLPESSLLLTLRLTNAKKLKHLLKNEHYVEVPGMPELARKEYICRFFEDKNSGMKAFHLLRSNEMLFSMCQAPLVCWIACTCLKQIMKKDGDITMTCRTPTDLFTCYISGLFTSVDGCSFNLPNQDQLGRLCYLAAKGIWTMTYVFYRENFRKYGLTKYDVSMFLDMNILQRDRELENCYVFTHLHVQEFFAAMFYMLKDSWETRDNPADSFENLKSVFESKNDKDSHLMQMKCFLFGLLNEERIKQLEKALNCKLSLDVRQELLQTMEVLGKSDYSPSELGFLELFHYLYETQDEAFVCQAMSYFPKIDVNICAKIHLFVTSFCLKHCRDLQTIKFSVSMIFEKMSSSSWLPEIRQSDGEIITHCWEDLCSVLHTNEHLKELSLCKSKLDKLAMKTFYQGLRHPNCKPQTLLLKFVSFPDGCRGISKFLTQSQNLTHLDLTGSDLGDNGMKSLCEALKHPNCKVQNLRLECCDLTAVCCLNISKALISNQNLIILNLSTNNLLDDGVKLLCEALSHPKCRLERLSLESCGLTEVGCEDLSLAIVGNQSLTHLCLADNMLGDGGVKFMSDALAHPQCTLQSLVLNQCHFTSASSGYLSASLMHNKSLRHLDLGLNNLQDEGAKLLCDVFRRPSCNLQAVGLTACRLTSACCLDLASAISNNPNVGSLELGYNDLQDSGVKILCVALRHRKCNIQKLGLECCSLTALSCDALVSTLIGNQKLKIMNLTQNALGYEGIKKLSEVLRSAICKLQVLGLCKEVFDEETQKLLEAVTLRNPRLVIQPNCKDHDADVSWWRCSDPSGEDGS